MTNFTLTDDILDVRDIIARVQELREKMAGAVDDSTDCDSLREHAAELETLEKLLAELCGNGGDEQWEGDWYPVTLIRDSHFQDYAKELARDCGMVKDGAAWPNNCIDWEKAATELQNDYSSVEINEITYWYR